MEASTDLAMRAKILAYSRAHGVFAGVALDGSTLRPDEDANEALYGREIRPREIVRGSGIPVPSEAMPLIQYMEQAVRVASEAKPPEHGQQR
jgi:lipid-binding SYLF domain-containing protein